MAFGACNAPYTAPCKFFSDDPSRDNSIRWYYVPDDREIYDDWTTFTPRIDALDITDDSLYEHTALRTNLRRHHKGIDIDGFPGTHFHGSREDFLGESKRVKYFGKYDVRPEAPCMAWPASRVVFGGDLVVPVGNCPCCAFDQAPDSFTVHVDCPAYPEIDGLDVLVSNIPEAEVYCDWFARVEVAGGYVFAMSVRSHIDVPGQIEIACYLAVPGDPVDFPFMHLPLTLAQNFHCDPWSFDHTDGVEDPTGTGPFAIIRLTAFGASYTPRFISDVVFETGFIDLTSPIGGVKTSAVKFGDEFVYEPVLVPEFESLVMFYTEAETIPPPFVSAFKVDAEFSIVVGLPPTFESAVKFGALFENRSRARTVVDSSVKFGALFENRSRARTVVESSVKFGALWSPWSSYAFYVTLTADYPDGHTFPVGDTPVTVTFTITIHNGSGSFYYWLYSPFGVVSDGDATNTPIVVEGTVSDYTPWQFTAVIREFPSNDEVSDEMWFYVTE